MWLILYLLVASSVLAAQENGFKRRWRRQAPEGAVEEDFGDDTSEDEYVTKKPRFMHRDESEEYEQGPRENKQFLAKKKSYLEKHKDEYILMGIMTSIFGSIFLFAPVVVNCFKLKEGALIKVCIMLTTFCFWLFWMVVYIAQLNPLLGPRLDNSTLLWMSRIWGRAFTEDELVDEDDDLRRSFTDSYSDFDDSA